jgi:hypothetical protein
VLGDEPGKAPRLVRGQGIHRVDDERLDATLASLTWPRTVIEHWVDKTFRFAAASTSSDQGMRCHPIARQTLPCLALMCVGRVFGLEAAKKIPAGAVMPEGQAHLQVRPFHPGQFVVDEAMHNPMEEAIGWLEACEQELLNALLNVVRQE